VSNPDELEQGSLMSLTDMPVTLSGRAGVCDNEYILWQGTMNRSEW